MMVPGEMFSSKTRSRVLLVLTYIFSIGCLIWTLRSAHLGELSTDLADMDWTWVAIGAIADVLVYLWHGWRWSLLLQPVAPVTYWQSVRAIYVGLFANEVLPFRAGEVVRCYLLARWTDLPVSVALSSAIIERVFDGIWLVLGLFLTLRFAPFPHKLHRFVEGGYLLGCIILAAAVLLGIMMFRKQERRKVYSEVSWKRTLQILIEDLRLIGHSKYLYFSAFASLPYLLIQVIPIYAVMRAYGFELSLGAAGVIMLILRLSAVVPQAPGNLGMFQFVTTAALVEIYHVVPAEAARFSLVLWGVVTLPLLIVGFIVLVTTGSKLTELHHAAKESTADPAAR